MKIRVKSLEPSGIELRERTITFATKLQTDGNETAPLTPEGVRTLRIMRHIAEGYTSRLSMDGYRPGIVVIGYNPECAAVQSREALQAAINQLADVPLTVTFSAPIVKPYRHTPGLERFESAQHLATWRNNGWYSPVTLQLTLTLNLPNVMEDHHAIRAVIDREFGLSVDTSTRPYVDSIYTINVRALLIGSFAGCDPWVLAQTLEAHIANGIA